jgi:hypothetical protein
VLLLRRLVDGMRPAYATILQGMPTGPGGRGRAVRDLRTGEDIEPLLAPPPLSQGEQPPLSGISADMKEREHPQARLERIDPGVVKAYGRPLEALSL